MKEGEAHERYADDLSHLDFSHFLYANALHASGLRDMVVKALVHNAREIAGSSKKGEVLIDPYKIEADKARELITSTISSNIRREHESGKEAGYQAGLKVGLDQGYGQGFQKGQKDGYQAGKTMGYEKGNTEGYGIGRAEGYKKGNALLSKAGLTKVFAGMLLGASGMASYSAYKAEQDLEPKAGNVNSKSQTTTNQPEPSNLKPSNKEDISNPPKKSKPSAKVRSKSKQKSHQKPHPQGSDHSPTTYDLEDGDVDTND